MKKLYFLFFFIASFGYSQDRFPLDTMTLHNDTIVLFSDHSWEYMEFLNFDGVTNHWLDSLVRTDSNYQYVQDWNNHMPFTYDNDLSRIPDTLWMCVVDSNHTNFAIPRDDIVTSTFKWRGGRMHHGVDIDLDVGDTVFAVFDGIVRYAEYNKSGYGNLVIIRHYNGLETYYAHLSQLDVSANQRVQAGESIGLGGKTGRAYGAHLHFEVRLYHNSLDPEEIFDFENKTLKDENLLVHKDLFDYKMISSSKATPSSSVKENPELADVKFHKIRKGDSLYGLALKYGTSVDSLCKLNGITRETILHIGQVLKIRE